MSPNSQNKALQGLLNNKASISIDKALYLLRVRSKAIKKRRYKQVDLDIDRCLFMSEVTKCNDILRSM